MTLEGWNYRKSHIITHPTGGLTNYQTKIRVYRTTGIDSGDTVYIGDKCLADYGDIRFINSAGTELDYWMETNAGSYADFWVEIDSIETSTNIYIYYGNSSATTTSNGDTTFLFFDDFTTLDTSKWTVTGSPSISSGVCTIQSGSGLTSKSTYGVNYAIRSKVSLTSGVSGALPSFGFGKYFDTTHICYLTYQGGNHLLESKSSTASGTTGFAYDTNYHIFDIVRHSTTLIQGYRDSIADTPITTNIATDTFAIIS